MNGTDAKRCHPLDATDIERLLHEPLVTTTDPCLDPRGATYWALVTIANNGPMTLRVLRTAAYPHAIKKLLAKRYIEPCLTVRGADGMRITLAGMEALGLL